MCYDPDMIDPEGKEPDEPKVVTLYMPDDVRENIREYEVLREKGEVTILVSGATLLLCPKKIALRRQVAILKGSYPPSRWPPTINRTSGSKSARKCLTETRGSHANMMSF